MLIQLKSGVHIDATKIIRIIKNEEKYNIEMINNASFELDQSEFEWLVKICGFLIELKSKIIINTKRIVAIFKDHETNFISLDNGVLVELSEEECPLLATECNCTNLGQRIDFLSGLKIPCDDYKKL